MKKKELVLGIHDASYEFKDCFDSQLDYLSASKLKKLDEGIWAFVSYYILGRKKPRTAALDLGDLIHKALLRPKEFSNKFIVEPVFKGKGSKAAYEDWAATISKDAVLITEKECDQVNSMINALQCDEYAWGLLNSTQAERIIISEGRGGCHYVSIPDFFREDGLYLDFKNRATLKDDSFSKDLFNFQWWIQIGFYLIAGEQFLKKACDEFVFVLACNQLPFDTDVFPIDPETIEISKMCTDKLIDKYISLLPKFKEAEMMARSCNLAKLLVDNPSDKIKANFELEYNLRRMFVKRKDGPPAPTGMPGWALSKLADKYEIRQQIQNY